MAKNTLYDIDNKFRVKLEEIKNELQKRPQLKNDLKKLLSPICEQDDDLKEVLLYVLINGSTQAGVVYSECKIPEPRRRRISEKLQDDKGLLVFEDKVGRGDRVKSEIHPTNRGAALLSALFENRDILLKEDVSHRRAYALLIVENPDNKIKLLYSESIGRWTFPGKLYHQTGKREEKMFRRLIKDIFNLKITEVMQFCSENKILQNPHPECTFSEMDTVYEADLYEITSTIPNINNKIINYDYRDWSELKRTKQKPFSRDKILKNKNISQKPKCYVAALMLKEIPISREADIIESLSKWDKVGLNVKYLETFFRMNPKLDTKEQDFLRIISKYNSN